MLPTKDRHSYSKSLINFFKSPLLIFAYEFRDGAAIGLLPNKETLIVYTSATPIEMYPQLGMDDVLKKTSDFTIFQFCGMKVIDHVFFGAVPHVDDQVRKGYIQHWKEILQKNS